MDQRLWDESEERLVRFLLGRLPPAEREEIENRIVAEDGFLEEVLATGDELSRAYLNGRLSGEDRVRFETHFLASAPQRRRFEEMRDLASAMRSRPRSRPRTPPIWMLAAAAVILVVVGVVLTQRPGSSRPGETRIAQETPTRPAPRRVRGETTPQVRLPARPSEPIEIPLSAETRHVRLEVPIDDDRHPTFDASLRTPDGVTVWQETDMLAPGPGVALVLLVPAEVLAADAYSLLVEGEKLRDPRHKRVSITYTLRVARPR